MKKILFILAFFIGTISTFAQDLDQYKYIIIPEKFEFSKEENQYQLNALTKFLFEKYGFETLMKSEQKPLDLQENYCLGLTASVKDNSGLFVTKLVVQLEDCRGNIVFESKEGRSRIKEFKDAHHEALRDAFSTIEELNYEYDPSEVSAPTASETKEAQQAVEKAEVAQTEPETEPVKTSEEIETSTTAPAEVVVENPMVKNASAKELNFEKDGINYSLEKSDSGYSFYQENSEEPFAVLAKSGGQNSFIYKSLTRQGVAYFDEGGNLIVEYLNAENKSVKLVYKASANQ
ncbi:hypothetical protein [Salegentibacter mishustinae]|uniref:Uncharacterized protein n=1 Tax=Salegentibacter mishustinae TaxID=270918 RepID=A0A0Q9Z959_9FLAO|nr:hypothetical protein [Salegentibacter mishustinae]KRG28585.1 hypothetical protein APR42_07370 [Salegentibacter mishustinae]PNW22518.1 hypothetical protein APB85_15130 [Salegentibacter mishustinae]PZX67760.1 hypothetical protein LY54_00498 [Salegentibacter mishustinae]GGW77553.1 hypothetical protein GCM10008086_01190 [Salegentibacter mishustinae]